jgi:hypothetical protein
MKNKRFHKFHIGTLQTYLEYVDQSLLEPTTKALEQQSFSLTLPGLQLPYQWIWFSTESGFDFPAHVFNGCFVTTPLLPYRARMQMFFACMPTRSQTEEKLVVRVNGYRNSGTRTEVHLFFSLNDAHELTHALNCSGKGLALYATLIKGDARSCGRIT